MQVANEEASTFGLHHALLMTPDRPPVCLTDVRVSPEVGGTVQYARFAHERATIVVDDKGADLAPISATIGTPLPPWSGRADPPVQLVLDPAAADCKASDTARLPVVGVLASLGEETSFGDDPAEPGLTLLSGTVQTLVRAVRFSWLNLSTPGELFAVKQTTLPPGSTLRGAVTTEGTEADWWGFADIDFSDTQDRGFQVEAATHARTLDIVLPAALSHRGEAEDKEHLSVTLTERVESDPALRTIAITAALVSTLAAIMSFLRGKA